MTEFIYIKCVCGENAPVGKPSEYEPSIAEFECSACGKIGTVKIAKLTESEE